jgi:hypothetical protein
VEAVPFAQVDCVVLSPHPDDAVLSAWHALVAPGGLRVVTIFAGIPAAGLVTPLDGTRSATDAAALMRRRRDDDRAALALAGREVLHGGLLEVNYLAADLPEVQEAIRDDPERFVEIVADVVGLGTPVDTMELAIGGWLRADLVYAPLGVGRHPDHRDVARLGLRLSEQGRRVRFYADFPYLIRYGPPSWLGGGDAAAPADAQIAAAFAALGADPADFERSVVELTREQAEGKIAAFRRYRTEFPLVDADFAGATSDPDKMRIEVYWTRP